jgi:TonB-dependent SusC/RagA subfamily outer membrane receptor
MISLLLFFISFIPFQNSASDTLTVTSKIENVTVFRSQAQIERTATVSLKKGKTTVVFTDLSELMITNSIQLKGTGDFTLLSLTNRTNFIEAKVDNKKIRELMAQRDSLQDQITSLRAQLKVIDSNIGLLNSSTNITNNHKLSATELDALLDLNSKRMLEFEKQKIGISSEIKDIDNKIQLINNKIRESGAVTRNRFKEVIAEVEVGSANEMEFALQYLVYNSGWNPSYDIRSESVSEPMNITFKANIYQNTGYDWNDVQFTINSGDPSENVQKPELTPNYVGFYSENNIRLRGNSSFSDGDKPLLVVDGVIFNGTLEDLDMDDVESIEVIKGAAGASLYGSLAGNGVVQVITKKNKDISSALRSKTQGVQVLREAELSSVPINEKISNQTSFSYKIERPYSVPSDGKEHTLEIKRESPDTEYVYASVPKLSQNAYLIGNLKDWDELNLIEGEANVYFENSFVGSTYLDPSSLLDTLEISLGKDERIVVERKKLKDFEERRFFGSKTRESLSFEISIRNTKPESIEIIIQDQIPVSTDESIKVSHKELSGGELEKNTGIITWRLKLNPNGTKKLILNYELEYPKGKRINY